MNERKEFYGHWWLPNKKKKKVPGILISDPTFGISLYLFEKFKKFDRSSYQESIILGESVKGDEITLYNCLFGEMDLTSEQPLNKQFQFKYVANYMFIGALFKSEAEMKFDTLSVEYTNLNNWINISGYEPDPNRDLLFDTVVAYKRPDPIDLVKTDNFQLRFIFGHSYNMESIGAESQSIREHFHFLFNFAHEQKFENIYYYFNSLQNFMCLAMNNSVYPISIHIQSKKKVNKFGDGSSFKKDIEFIYLPSSRRRVDRDLYFFDMLLPYSAIKSRTSDIFSKFFESYSELEDIYSGYFDVLYDPSMAQRKKFLELMRVLESYHHARLVTKDISLAARLEDIKNRFPLVFIMFINVPDFLEKVKKGRHYWTHLNINQKKNAVKDKELFKVVRGLTILVEACLLYEIGFSSEEVAELIRKNNIHKHYIQD